eukprot:6062668-Amphidinium_carterae.1
MLHSYIAVTTVTSLSSAHFPLGYTFALVRFRSDVWDLANRLSKGQPTKLTISSFIILGHEHGMGSAPETILAIGHQSQVTSHMSKKREIIRRFRKMLDSAVGGDSVVVTRDAHSQAPWQEQMFPPS